MGFAPSPACFASLSPHLHAQYALLEEIGVGGSGFVLKVRRRTDGLVLAAKLVARDRVPRQNLVRTASWGFVPHGFDEHEQGGIVVPAEAYALRRLTGHPGVCGLVDLFADELFYYLIMEYHGASWQTTAVEEQHVSLPPTPPISPLSAYAPLSRTASEEQSLPSPSAAVPPPPPMMRRSPSDLFDWVERQGHFSEAYARFIFHQLVHTACDLARSGVLHRDWKDENICIDEKLRVKLVDFGSVVMFDPSGPAPVQHEKRFYGTCTYAAPEVFAGVPYAMLPAEVWALGVLLHVLLTGENPFRSPAEAAAGARVETRVSLSPMATDLLDRCLTVDAGARISLEEMRRHPWVSGQWTA
ncbi:hypothetical protein JCM10450v2_006993 [Rhodotorula kratochvilovae]